MAPRGGFRDQPTTEKEINSNLTYDPTLAVTRVRITRFDGRRLATLTCFDIVVGCVCSREPSSEFSLILSSATMVHAPQVALKVCWHVLTTSLFFIIGVIPDNHWSLKTEPVIIVIDTHSVTGTATGHS